MSLDFLPIGALGVLIEQVGVALDQTLTHSVAHVVQVKAPRVLLDAGMEDDLQKHVAQLLLHVVGIVLIQSLAGLVGLFQKIAPDGLVGLGPVPGAAPRSAEQTNQRHKVGSVIAGFPYKI